MAGVCVRVGIFGFCVYGNLNQADSVEDEDKGKILTGVFIKFSPISVALNKKLNNNGSQKEIKTSVFMKNLSQTTNNGSGNANPVQEVENRKMVKKSVIFTGSLEEYKELSNSSNSDNGEQTEKRKSVFLSFHV